MPYGYPSLTPAYGLGSYGRTSASILISCPRTKNASQARVYAYMKNHGQGQAYEQFLIQAMGLKYLPRVNPWTYI